jgi:transcriptional regulator with XRE-family HTH domain
LTCGAESDNLGNPLAQFQGMKDRDRYYRQLGSKIRETREAEGLTQAQLAESVGLSRTSVTNIESGRQRLLIDQFESICTALGKRSIDLLPATHEKQLKQRAVRDELRSLPSVQEFVTAVRRGVTDFS